MNKNLSNNLMQLPPYTFIALFGNNMPNKYLMLHKIDKAKNLIALYDSKGYSGNSQLYVFDMKEVVGFTVRAESIPDDRLTDIK